MVDFKTMEQARGEGIWVFSRGGKTQAPETPTSAAAMYPVVKFEKAKYASGVHRDQVLIGPSVVDVLNANGGVEASRVQVPLILAWVSPRALIECANEPEALTIHKSESGSAAQAMPMTDLISGQGQTIERLRVQFKEMFADGQHPVDCRVRPDPISGQAYVALSRAVSLDNLQIENFDVQG